jgi:chromosome segregation ATPase
VAGGCEPGGGPGTTAWREAVSESWRQEDHNWEADEKIRRAKLNASAMIDDIRKDIELAQERFHQADVEANKWQNRKQRGTLPDEDILKDAQEERQKAWAELQRQKARIEKVEDYRNKSIGEIRALRDRANNGDYHGYLGLREYQTGYFPERFK